MLTTLRHLIRSNPTLYWLWLKVNYGYPHKLPDQYSDLHIDGFQRSGNTFSTNLLRTVFHDKKIVSHFHAIASLKTAIRYNTPIMIVVRDPSEAIASSIAKRVFGHGFNRERSYAYDLKGYTDYYRFILKNQKYFHVIFFDQFISDPSIIVATAARLLDVETPDQATIDQAVEEVYRDLKSDNRPAAMNTLGSAEKTELKNKVLDEISNHPDFKKALETYEGISRAFR